MSDLFRADWWLDAVAPGGWGEVVSERGGQRLADLRYTLWSDRFGVARLGVGPLTPRLGPMFYLEAEKTPTRLGRENEAVRDMVQQLPRYDYLSLTLPATVTNALPFHWLGFGQTTRYSYLLEDPADLHGIWNGMAETTRRAIRKAQKVVEVVEGDVDSLTSLARATFRRREMSLPYSERALSRAVDAARAHASGTIRSAVDSQSRKHASALFVWDSERVYYLVGGADSELRSSGAMSLVIWDGIQLANQLGLRFDFEGSMIAPIERFFRGFGGRPEPYLHVTHTSRRLAFALAARDAFRALTRRRLSSRLGAHASPSDPAVHLES